MKLLALNLAVMCFVAAPVALLGFVASRWPWLQENKEMVGIVLWVVTLFLAYNLLAPMLGLEPVIYHCGEKGESPFCP
jgi:hypothetical protein